MELRRRIGELTAGATLALLSACGAKPADPAATAQTADTPPPQTGVASYYHPDQVGDTTASGAPARSDRLTAASPNLPLGADAKVTNTETGQSVTVEVNDRGPHAKGRILDVSPKAAEKLGMKHDGTAKVVVQPVAKGG